MAKAIGIDVGGTNLRIGIFDDIKLLHEIRVNANFSTICKQNEPEIAWQIVLDTITNGIESILTQYPDLQHIGIGFPGFIDPATKTIAQSPNFPGLKNVNLAHDLSKKLGKNIAVENDANVAAYGEYFLAGKPAGGMIYLGLGTGIGGGIVFQDELYSGQHGCAMEVGHIIIEHDGRLCGCGNRGCVEQYASASGISLSYYNATLEQRSAADIAQLANAGDEHAINAYDIAAQSLAQALATILKIVDVSNVVIGGGVVGAWDLLANAFHQRLNLDLIPVLRDKITINTSHAHDIAGMLGAAMLAAMD